ncbi:MAG: EAL domain-containing protein [Burkholderiales bacterium]|nr:EAL domain-containing protein [Burkholderiales bacterium]
MNQPQLSRDHVLLVDDDPVARLLTASFLTSSGFEVTEAASGAEALRCFDDDIDCILLDALMPDMDGFATCRALRAAPGGAQVPILMLTGLDDDDSVARAYDAGATDFFVKSTQWTLLTQRTRYLLRAARTRDELEASRARLSRAQRIARFGSWECDVATSRITGSELYFAVLGRAYHEAPVYVAELFALVHPDDLPGFERKWDALVRGGGEMQAEVRLRHGNGRYLHVLFDAEAERDARGRTTVLTGTVQDVTQRREAEAQIQALAYYDNLTGLPNRRMFGERLRTAIDEASRRGGWLAALFVDLDRFKQVNDSQGHGAGDQLLREVAQRLVGCVRAGDADTDMVARLGGDEFVLLLTGITDANHPQRVAERALAVLREPFVINGRENFISASIGISRFPDDGADAETLLRNADAAMYAVKGNGRNAIAAYRPEFNVADRRRWELEQALHKALERNELVLHYQPQVDVRTGRVPGVEALMRWQHLGRLVPPGEFIPLAEETGLIVPFGEWALRTAAAQAAQWMHAGHGRVRVAVNIPGSHFQRRGFVDMVRAALVGAGIGGELLELEITETMLMNDLSATLATLRALNELGVRLSIDDFGTGYSSLSYLKRFDINQLKIDRSFVNDLKPDSDNEAITAAIIAMATALKLEVVAEGVESREQMLLLNRRGCQLMQGYYFSRPLPASDITTLLDRLRDAGPRAEWRIADGSRSVALVPRRTAAQAA